MNYNKHYITLVERARLRVLDIPTERHHIIPKCMGGSDAITNLVELTPEEHYVAHQLLVKIYNGNEKLVYAANMMCVKRNNKLYGWLRRRLVAVAKQRTKEKNGSFGKPWYHNPITGESGKFIPGTEPVNWIKGRSPKKIKYCESCNIPTNTILQNWCDNCRKKLKKQTVFKSEKIQNEYTEIEKLAALEKHDGNIRRALFSLGLNDSGSHYRTMKKLKCAGIPPRYERGER